MWCVKYLLIVSIVAMVAILAAGRPHEHMAFLSDVANKTMCPIKVVIDDNPDRVPRRIKFLMCDENPNRLCVEHEMHHGCCKRRHHNYVTECIEIYDWVQVTYKDSPSPSTVKVPVGCTCMIEETTMATVIS